MQFCPVERAFGGFKAEGERLATLTKGCASSWLIPVRSPKMGQHEVVWIDWTTPEILWFHQHNLLLMKINVKILKTTDWSKRESDCHMFLMLLLLCSVPWKNKGLGMYSKVLSNSLRKKGGGGAVRIQYIWRNTDLYVLSFLVFRQDLSWNEEWLMKVESRYHWGSGIWKPLEISYIFMFFLRHNPVLWMLWSWPWTYEWSKGAWLREINCL